MNGDFDFEIDLSGLKELEEKLNKAVTVYPDKAQTTLERLGRQFRKRTIDITFGKAAIKNRKENLKKGYHTSRVKGYGMNMEVEFRATAPHFHLLENGHEKYIKGKHVGFTPGRHMVEMTREEYKDIVPKELEKMTSDILRKSGLV